MHLSDFDHFRNNPFVKFKTETVNSEQLTIVSYMIADSDFWTLPLARETRGITFDSSGNCISRPLEKMFNINERVETQIGNLDFEDAQFFTKRDGSMITPVLVGGDIFWKSKKSFFSDVAKRVEHVVPANVIELSRKMLEAGATPIFEFTDPNHQIVLDYGQQPKFVLLAVRKIASGSYVPYCTCLQIANQLGVECIDRHYGEPTALIDSLKSAVNTEGYIIHHKNGQKTKIKCPWYVINHRIMTELRERDIATAVIEETIDDMKAALVTQGKELAPVLIIEDAVIFQLEGIMIETKQLCDKLKQFPSRKEAAMIHHKHPLFSLAMSLYDGKDPDYKQFWKKHHLKVDYSLRVVYNQTFGSE